MANEVAQWVAVVGLALFVFGLYRHLGMVLNAELGDIAATSGPRLGHRLRRSVIDEIGVAYARRWDGVPGPLKLAFVSEDCVACSRLIANLEDELRRGVVDPREVVLIARNPTDAYSAALLQLPVVSIADSGAMFRDTNVQATPFVVVVTEDQRVIGKHVTHKLEDLDTEDYAEKTRDDDRA